MDDMPVGCLQHINTIQPGRSDKYRKKVLYVVYFVVNISSIHVCSVPYVCAVLGSET